MTHKTDPQRPTSTTSTTPTPSQPQWTELNLEELERALAGSRSGAKKSIVPVPNFAWWEERPLNPRWWRRW